MDCCLLWMDNNLIEDAKKRKIIPITPDRLESKLKKLEIFDPRIPLCPAPK